MDTDSVTELLAEAAELVQMFEYQEAVQKFYEAHQLEPENTTVLDQLAEVLLEIGQVDDAQHLLERSIEIRPNDGFSKYMNLGQISTGFDAVKAFRKGIEIIRMELALKSQRKDAKANGLKRQLVSAYVSIGELYMTDLCDEPDAEQACGTAIDEALIVDPHNWEVLQVLASYRISQQNPEDAVTQLSRSFESWREMEPNDIDRPSYDHRLAAAKMFVELEAYELGSEVLETLLEDNDEDPEIWYLTAFCYFHTDVHAAPEYLDQASHLLAKQKVNEPIILNKVDDLDKQIHQKIATLPPPEAVEETEDE